MPPGVPTKPAVIASLLTGALVLAACSDDGSPQTDDTVTTPTSTPASPSTSPAATSIPADDLPFPGVAPADGLRLRLDGASIHVPQGWKRDPSYTGLDKGAVGPDAFVQLVDQATVDFGAVGLGEVTPEELEQFVLSSLERGSPGVRYRLRDPIEIDGHTVVRATGTDRTLGSTTEVFQALRGDRFVSVTIIASERGATPLSELVPAVINSWAWV
jgi:hypothetical protein